MDRRTFIAGLLATPVLAYAEPVVGAVSIAPPVASGTALTLDKMRYALAMLKAIEPTVVTFKGERFYPVVMNHPITFKRPPPFA